MRESIRYHLVQCYVLSFSFLFPRKQSFYYLEFVDFARLDLHLSRKPSGTCYNQKRFFYLAKKTARILSIFFR
jgi:hypothetical protein